MARFGMIQKALVHSSSMLGQEMMWRAGRAVKAVLLVNQKGKFEHCCRILSVAPNEIPLLSGSPGKSLNFFAAFSPEAKKT